MSGAVIRGVAHMPGLIIWPDAHEFVGYEDGFGDGVHALLTYRSDTRGLDCPCPKCVRRRRAKLSKTIL